MHGILTRLAKFHSLTTYGDLVKMMHAISLKPNDSALGKMIGGISKREEIAENPML
ncbi:MAG: hypothetical protein Q7J27_11655 [Syntrophales bacterium]|nr:hypothetical protein [Syntrophales bacterium]